MKAAQMRVLVTGGSSGIGRALAVELHRRGAAVLLVGRDGAALGQALESMGGRSLHADACVADLATAEGRAHVAATAASWGGPGINVLVNNAGLGEFGLLSQADDAAIERLFAINAIAPVLLTRALLGQLTAQPEAVILNIGSVFGSLGYPGFAAYSATKFALRGFTEALRRELADTRVGVRYFAPRATRTGMNADTVERMNAELGVAMDPPATVAVAACNLLESGRLEAVFGWPEKLFVRINALLPRVVDGSLRKQLPAIRRHAAAALAGRAPIETRRETLMQTFTRVALLCATLLAVPSQAAAPADPAFDAELLAVQQAWARVNYEMPAGDARNAAFEALEKRAEAFTHQHPTRAEALIWEGIVESSYAGAKGGLGALSLAKEARGNLEAALKLDPKALDGSAYTSLGTLYYKVPGFPLGFGDHDKAGQLLQQALKLNPNGIDPNYFYAEYLFEQGKYQESLQHLERAGKAAPRPGRELADKGRRAEIATLQAKVKAKQG